MAQNFDCVRISYAFDLCKVHNMNAAKTLGGHGDIVPSELSMPF